MEALFLHLKHVDDNGKYLDDGYDNTNKNNDDNYENCDDFVIFLHKKIMKLESYPNGAPCHISLRTSRISDIMDGV